MNNLEIGMCKAIANFDMSEARNFLKYFLEADNKKCDEGIKNDLLPKLNMKTIELPANVKGLVEAEDVSDYFNDGRYKITEKDNEIVKKVIDTWNIRSKLAEYHIKYLNSLLLYGKHGCGKTMLGRYIAYKSKLPFIYLNFSNIISSYLGSTGENIQKVFDYIEENKCVLMLDELDAVGIERGNKDDVGEMDRIVINVMQCLDKASNDCIIIAATNRFDRLDKALVRRFSLKYQLEPPSDEIKSEIVKAYLDSIPSQYTENEVFEFVKDIDSCANLKNILVNRIVECVVQGNKVTLEAKK